MRYDIALLCSSETCGDTPLDAGTREHAKLSQAKPATTYSKILALAKVQH
jgi:hypothetical protein